MIRKCGGAILAVVVAAALGTSAVAVGQCPDELGDIDGDGGVDVADVQCLVLVLLEVLAVTEEPPACLDPEAQTDLDGDTQLDIVDAVVLAAFALGAPLPEAIDQNANGCPDGYEATCGDLICASNVGEGCATCQVDCGSCADPCCEAHGGAGCAEAVVADCVCAISDFCCTTLWDESCASLAVDFCDPSCGGDGCTLEGAIACGEVAFGTTEGASASLSGYVCGGESAGGPERVYVFVSEEGTGLDVTLDGGLGTSLSLRVLSGGCSSDACIGVDAEDLTLFAPAGEPLFFVVDGPEGEPGKFELEVTCDSDCDAEELCAGQECGTIGCAGLNVSCGECETGESCVGGSCVEVILPEGCPGEGSCFAPNDSPGCTDPACCESVCLFDSFCCETSWTGDCANAAEELCDDFMEAVCGDEICQGTEGTSCPEDCFVGEGICGDGFCTEDESVTGCPGDCSLSGVCGDAVCVGVEWLTCPADCPFGLTACPSKGPCNQDNGTPGCNEQACCNAVCQANPSCCTDSWSGVCATLQFSLCGL